MLANAKPALRQTSHASQQRKGPRRPFVKHDTQGTPSTGHRLSRKSINIVPVYHATSHYPPATHSLWLSHTWLRRLLWRHQDRGKSVEPPPPPAPTRTSAKRPSTTANRPENGKNELGRFARGGKPSSSECLDHKSDTIQGLIDGNKQQRPES